MLNKLLSCLIIAALFAPVPSLAQDNNKKKVPDEKGGLLDANSVVRGSGFRITVVHPMRGNFAEYDKLEIVDLTSDIGSRIPAGEMEKYTARLFASFEKSDVFQEVRRAHELDFSGLPPREKDGGGGQFGA